MPTARKKQVCLETTPYYHCISRCVRRAFLCGKDSITGRSFEHRKQWMVDYLKQQTEAFCIEICAYAVMSNHHHTVLYVDTEKALALEPFEVLIRWQQLFSLPEIAEKYLNDENLNESELNELEEYISLIRSRLTDISWFMRHLNEKLARRANKEDNCKGRFWEGRFKSQALLDEAAVLTCMTYVDLNPVRAGVADSLETSDFTSIQERINNWQQESEAQPKHLAELSQSDTNSTKNNLSNIISLESYIELVDWSSRIVRSDKKGVIPADAPPVLAQMKINPEKWCYTMQPAGNRFRQVLGATKKVKAFAKKLGQQWLQGLSDCRQLFGT